PSGPGAAPARRPSARRRGRGIARAGTTTAGPRARPATTTAPPARRLPPGAPARDGPAPAARRPAAGRPRRPRPPPGSASPELVAVESGAQALVPLVAGRHPLPQPLQLEDLPVARVVPAHG